MTRLRFGAAMAVMILAIGGCADTDPDTTTPGLDTTSTTAFDTTTTLIDTTTTAP